MMQDTMTKAVAIVVVGAGADTAEVKETKLHPGMTVREVLDELGLQDYQLSRGKGTPFLDDEDNLYAMVEKPGDKFWASTVADQG